MTGIHGRSGKAQRSRVSDGCVPRTQTTHVSKRRHQSLPNPRFPEPTRTNEYLGPKPGRQTPQTPNLYSRTSRSTSHQNNIVGKSPPPRRVPNPAAPGRATSPPACLTPCLASRRVYPSPPTFLSRPPRWPVSLTGRPGRPRRQLPPASSVRPRRLRDRGYPNHG